MAHDFSTGPRCFVFDEGDELTPARIADRLGKVMILDHAFDVQCLKSDSAKGIDDLATEFVVKVFASIRYLLMGGRHAKSSLVAPVATLDGASETALSNLDQVLSFTQVLWWCDLDCAVLATEDRKVFQAQINPDGCLISRWLNVYVKFALDGDKIATGLGFVVSSAERFSTRYSFSSALQCDDDDEPSPIPLWASRVCYLQT